MKIQFLRLLISGLLLTLPTWLFAQIGFNSPAGITPKQDMEMYSRNSFLMQQKYILTTDPFSTTVTMNCAANPPTLTNTAGILHSPGYPGNYSASQVCSQTISAGNSLTAGYEITFDFLNTEANGDSVILEDLAGGRIAFSGTAKPPVLIAPFGYLKVTLKSDNDGNTGSGFQLRWRLVTLDTNQPILSNTYFGNAFQFDAARGSLTSGLPSIGTALKAGLWSTNSGLFNLAQGSAAVALGSSNQASDDNAVALGGNNTASAIGAIAIGAYNLTNGVNAVTMGSSNTATGLVSVAIGNGNKLLGNTGIALGGGNVISGQTGVAIGGFNLTSGFSDAITIGSSSTASAVNSIAIGYNNQASGFYSTAMGTYVSTNGQSGAYILGDNGTTTRTNSTAINQYTSRFAGGYRLFSNSATTIGVQLAAGGNAWSAISDSTKKERFLPLNHADLLTKLRTLRLGTWNYKGQRTERHYGPMAQDFFARFGHDALGVIGCDTLLNSHDFTAITLSGVQALALENEQLKARITQLEQERVQADARLESLERAVLLRPAPRTTASTRRKRTR